MRILLVILTVFVFLSLTRLLSSNGGIGEYLSLTSRVDELNQFNQQKSDQNQLLTEEVRDLQTGQQAIETIARQQLGMVAQGEVFIKFLEIKPSNIPAPQPNESEMPVVIENPLPINKIEH